MLKYCIIIFYFFSVIGAKGETFRRKSITDTLDNFVADERLTPDELSVSKKGIHNYIFK